MRYLHEEAPNGISDYAEKITFNVKTTGSSFTPWCRQELVCTQKTSNSVFLKNMSSYKHKSEFQASIINIGYITLK